ncbi:MAG: hypothetical protein M3O70_11105, partial [Actinomycetota bacterium]|nr:hypothetical protein [Actinomycetota bacterium]
SIQDVDVVVALAAEDGVGIHAGVVGHDVVSVAAESASDAGNGACAPAGPAMVNYPTLTARGRRREQVSLFWFIV